MKPDLIVGLGNPLMGDDGIGWHVAERLKAESPADGGADVLCGGTDLLRLAGEMEGRRHIFLIDAVLDPDRPGAVRVHNEDLDGLETSFRQSGHRLSLRESLSLLRIASPSLRAARFTVVTVAIGSAFAGLGLSHEMQAGLPEIVRSVHQLTAGCLD